MLKLSGLKKEREINVRLVTVFERESVNDLAHVIEQGLWRKLGSNTRSNSFKFGMV